MAFPFGATGPTSPSPGGGMFGNIPPANMFGNIGDYQNRLIMGGMGMLSGRNPSEQWGNALQGFAAGSQADTTTKEKAEARRKEEERNAAMQAALKSGDLGSLSPTMQGLLAVDPDLMRSVASNRLTPKESTSTTDMKEYQQAVAQGFKGTLMEYQIRMREAGRAQTTVNTGDWKIPPGYQAADPANPQAGVKPIPGGPAEQISPEVAARVGMANSFLKEAPSIRESLVQGEATGVYDRAKAGWDNASGQAQILRKMKSGTDALQRMLTGAGMPISEAQQYADRYLPTYTDNAASAAQKLDQLTMELDRIKEMVMRGRGGTAESDQDGWQDLGDGVRVRELP